MAETLPRLRLDLDFLPSPVPDRPGLLIRDPFRYSDATLIVPPALVECLQCFDGRQTDLDLRAALFDLTGDLRVGEIERHLRETLSQAGFCDDDVYRRMREAQHAAFARAARREPAHAGGAYPDDAPALREALGTTLDPGAQRTGLAGVAAPHVSIEGGRPCYAAAYSALGEECRERTFVVLGTSHYGEPERFGLTRKPFRTPFGEAQTDAALAGQLAASGGPAVKMEDYCHAVEHSIEFQIVFLQHRFGPQVKIVPILCGPYAKAIQRGTAPESDDPVSRFLGALGELAAREGERLCWVLGIDLAHMGRRYGDPFDAQAGDERMKSVAEADRARIDRVNAGDAAGFWAAVAEDSDPLKWCGSSALYTFLKAVPETRGELLDYGQWNIDPRSAVTFAALAFHQ